MARFAILIETDNQGNVHFTSNNQKMPAEVVAMQLRSFLKKIDDHYFETSGKKMTHL